MDFLKKMTELQIRNARYANPLTLLPGNVPIYEYFEVISMNLEGSIVVVKSILHEKLMAS